MKSFQINFLNYLLVIIITFAGTWYFISNDKNKLVSASEKSIPSVVTIISNQNKTFSNIRNGIGSGVIFSEDGYIVTNLHIICLLYTSPSPRDKRQSRMPSSA